MFRARSFVLALVLCTIGLTAHAAPRSITPLTKWHKGWGLENFTKLKRESPIMIGKRNKIDQIDLGHLGLSYAAYSAWEKTWNYFLGYNHKDVDRDGAAR
jgi:hypothetical protein